MEALNKKERTDAYASFMVFFLITAALLLLAVFFAYQVPFKENERLRKQLKKYEHENEFMNNYVGKLNETKALLDSVNMPTAQALVIDGNLAQKITSMSSMLTADSIRDKRMYELINQILLASQTDKKLLRNSSATESSLGNLQQEIANLRMQLSTCEQQKATMNQTLMMLQNQR